MNLTSFTMTHHKSEIGFDPDSGLLCSVEWKNVNAYQD